MGTASPCNMPSARTSPHASAIEDHIRRCLAGVSPLTQDGALAALEAGGCDVNFLGAGANGTVYKVTWRGEPCALKIVLNSKPEVACQLRAAELLHGDGTPSTGVLPLTCAYHDGDSKRPPSSAVIVMPEGTSFDEWVRENRRRPDFRHNLERIVRDVLDGAAYLHACGVCHTDIKPNNIVVKDGRGYLIDFGATRAENEEPELLTTYVYCPPHALMQAPNAALPTRAIDVWSLFVTILWCATGHNVVPLSAPDRASMLRHVAGYAECAELFERFDAERVDNSRGVEAAAVRDAFRECRNGEVPITKRLFAIVNTVQSSSLRIVLYKLFAQYKREFTHPDCTADVGKVIEAAGRHAPNETECSNECADAKEERELTRERHALKRKREIPLPSPASDASPPEQHARPAVRRARRTAIMRTLDAVMNAFRK